MVCMQCGCCCCRAPFLLKSNMSMVLFKAPDHLATQMHITATPLTGVMNNGNFAALLAFIGGNLDELAPSADVPAAPSTPPRTEFAPRMKFGPPPGDVALFRMTLALRTVNLLLEAEPKHWQATAYSALPLPFLRMQVRVLFVQWHVSTCRLWKPFATRSLVIVGLISTHHRYCLSIAGDANVCYAWLCR